MSLFGFSYFKVSDIEKMLYRQHALQANRYSGEGVIQYLSSHFKRLIISLIKQSYQMEEESPPPPNLATTRTIKHKS